MLVLFETPAGYALFKVKDSKMKNEDLSALFATPEQANDVVSLSGVQRVCDVCGSGKVKVWFGKYLYVCFLVFI